MTILKPKQPKCLIQISHEFRINQLQYLISHHVLGSCTAVTNEKSHKIRVCDLHCTGKVYAALRTATPPVSCLSLLITASEFMQRKDNFQLCWTVLQSRQWALRGAPRASIRRGQHCAGLALEPRPAAALSFLPSGNTKMVPGTFQLPLQTLIKSHFSLHLEHTHWHILPETRSWYLPPGHNDTLRGSVI